MKQGNGHNNPIIGIYLIAFPVSSETFIVTKLLGLMDAGFNIIIFTSTESKDWDRFEVLKSRLNIRKHVVVLPQLRFNKSFLRKGLLPFVSNVITHPLNFVRLLAHCWRHRNDNPVHFLARAFVLSGFLGCQIDILHVEFDFQGLLVGDLKTFLNCKLTMSARGSHLRTSIPYVYPTEFHFLLALADGYHTISQYLHNELIKLRLPSNTPIWLIEPAIDLSLFAPKEIQNSNESDVFHILSVGRLSWAKGYEFAMDAVALLHNNGIKCHYTVVGDGEYRDVVYFAAYQHGLIEQGIVTFAGKRAHEEVIGYYESANVLLHLALEEGFANAVIEAQAMGLPVVCSDAGGLPENVEDGVTGFVVQRRNAKAAAERLAELANDSELRHHMGQMGIQRVHARFDIHDQIPKFIAMYKTVVEQHI